jgi:hypothetical protein
MLERVRIPIVLMWLFVALPLHAASQDLPAVATQGLDYLVKDQPDSAVALWTMIWISPADAGKRQTLVDSFRQLPQIAGPVLGYDLIRTVEVTPHLQRLYFLLRCQRQPVYVLLVLYRARDRWTVSGVNWHTDADHVLPPTLFGAEHPERP